MLQFELDRDNPHHIRLFGSLECEEDVDELLCELYGLGRDETELVLDLERLREIELRTVPTWIDMLERARALRPVAVRACSYNVGLLGQGLDLWGPAPVRSCKAPYYCPSCEREAEVLVEADDLPEEGVPAKRCEHCGSEMELNELEEFFSFLR